MAKKYHPDSGDESEIQKFHQVARAYKILSDPEAKKIYDLSVGTEYKEVAEAKTESVDYSAHKSKRASYRDDELKEFYQNRYKKAVFRVALFALFFGFFGGMTGAFLNDRFSWGFVAGIFIGFSFSIHQNFKIQSFFRSVKGHQYFRIFIWLLFLSGLGYFVWLVVKDLV